MKKGTLKWIEIGNLKVDGEGTVKVDGEGNLKVDRDRNLKVNEEWIKGRPPLKGGGPLGYSKVSFQ